MLLGVILTVIGLAMLLAIRYGRLTIQVRALAVVVFGWGVLSIIADLLDLW